jgi:hypothetical protein
MSGQAIGRRTQGLPLVAVLALVLGAYVAETQGQGPGPAPAPATPLGAPGKAASRPLAKIEVDRVARVFVVPGRIIRRDQPLEYLAVKQGGHKAYEAVLELDTSATDFNLACILIGLDGARSTPPEHHFDPRPVNGDQVELTLEWGEGDERKALDPQELFRIDGKPITHDAWVYTGSAILAPGRYLAEEAGTLVGFVHDRDSIIEHRSGIGLGAFGSTVIDKEMLPTEGTAIRLRVRNPAAAMQDAR